METLNLEVMLTAYGWAEPVSARFVGRLRDISAKRLTGLVALTAIATFGPLAASLLPKQRRTA